MTIYRKLPLLSMLILVLVLPTQVSAVMIDGEMSITGTFLPTGGTGLGDATGIDFMDINGDYGTQDGAFIVGAVSGSFADHISVGSFANPTVGYIQDINFASFSAVTPLWSVGGFRFDLLTLSVGEHTNDSLVLRGNGEIYGNNYERTLGSWVLTANGGKSTFSWSATTRVTEASSLSILGTCLILIAALSRKRLR